jgi:hypothetical protein
MTKENPQIPTGQRSQFNKFPKFVIPEKAGTHPSACADGELGSRFRGNDEYAGCRRPISEHRPNG